MEIEIGNWKLEMDGKIGKRNLEIESRKKKKMENENEKKKKKNGKWK